MLNPLCANSKSACAEYLELTSAEFTTNVPSFLSFLESLLNVGQSYAERLKLISAWKLPSNQFCLICSILEEQETALISQTLVTKQITLTLGSEISFQSSGEINFSWIAPPLCSGQICNSVQLIMAHLIHGEGMVKLCFTQPVLFLFSKMNKLWWSFACSLYLLWQLFLTLIFWLQISDWHRYTGKSVERSLGLEKCAGKLYSNVARLVM